jgi:hypothetical protein
VEAVNEKKYTKTIIAAFIVAAGIIAFVLIFISKNGIAERWAIRERVAPDSITQAPAYTYEQRQPETVTLAPTDPPTQPPPAPATATPTDAPGPENGPLAKLEINPLAATATITLLNGNTIVGNRHVENNTTFFTFYSDGSTETIRLQVPDNMVLVCTDDAVIEQMDGRGKSFIQSRQTSPSNHFTKAYGGAIVSITNYPNGKMDIWCAAN